ncbi:hypothetical protein [Cellulosimicrobium sp. Marseille-Q4280]|uniref:hypothetical protein n=1 Tax=Cellulosimicrobium sp. Marseille-Q4280 TaxID=2937992 RepID=UPI00203BACF9|nr:hypothetical protein [Cellulosimicrobium sp. Marseille-Q4280]
MTTNTPQRATTDIHHGYRLTKVKRMESRNGIGFSGTLTLDGAPVASVVQEGCGGQSFVHFLDGRGSATEKAFAAAAEAIFGADAFEPTESLLWRLETAAAIGRARTGAFVFGQAEADRFWDEDDADGGSYRQVNGLKKADTAEYLRLRYADKQPFIWSNDAATFVALDV